jgi:hypothetical protein
MLKMVATNETKELLKQYKTAYGQMLVKEHNSLFTLSKKNILV